MLKRLCYFLLAAFLVIISLSFLPIGSTDPQPEMEIYLLSSQIHTDIVVPIRNKVFDWETFFDPNDFKSRPTDWIEMGWGDRKYYFEIPTWDKFSLKTALDALFTPDQGIMHVNYLDMHPAEYSGARKIMISYATYEKLVNAIQEDFKTRDGKPLLIPNKGYSSTDNFFEGNGYFSILRTCNVWTSEKLGAVGLKRPLWSPTKYGLEAVW